MKVKVAEAKGPVLNWLVAKCENPNDPRDGRPTFWLHPNNPKLVCQITYNHETNPKGYELCLYTTDWGQVGPIIKKADIEFVLAKEGGHHVSAKWMAVIKNTFFGFGDDHIIAAMRCYVTSKLGEEVEVPEELAK